MTDSEAEQVVIWYSNLEAQLEGFLETVPFSYENQNVCLPLLAPLMVEAGSLIDTVFRKEFNTFGNDLKRPNIEDFARHFEKEYKLSQLKSLLYQHPPRYLEPFAGWTSGRTGNYVAREWWTSYNHLKHNRIEQYKLATLEKTILIICALQQVISIMPTFTRALWRHNFLHARSYTHYIGQNIEDSTVRVAGMVETLLFATPIGYERFPPEVEAIEAFFFGGKKLARFLGRG